MFLYSQVDEKGWTILHVAVSFWLKKEDEPSLYHLVNQIGDPNVKNKDGYTPLHAAVYWAKTNDQIFAIKTLLEHFPTDVNAVTDFGNMTALHIAADKSTCLAGVKLLLDHGADVNAFIRASDRTPPALILPWG